MQSLKFKQTTNGAGEMSWWLNIYYSFREPVWLLVLTSGGSQPTRTLVPEDVAPLVSKDTCTNMDKPKTYTHNF